MFWLVIVHRRDVIVAENYRVRDPYPDNGPDLTRQFLKARMKAEL